MAENEVSKIDETTGEEVIIAKDKGISAGTVARTVCLILALANQVLAIFGRESIPIADEIVYQFVSIIFTVVTAVSAWWKNNSFTQESRVADTIMKEMKGSK